MASWGPNGFVELEELVQQEDTSEVWEETARWVTLEETFESHGWSKPHIPCLTLEGLRSARDVLATCPLLIDLMEVDMASIVDVMVDEMICCGDLEESLRNQIAGLFLLNHRHKNRTKFNPLVRRFHRHFSIGPLENQGQSRSQRKEELHLDLGKSDSVQYIRCCSL